MRTWCVVGWWAAACGPPPAEGPTPADTGDDSGTAAETATSGAQPYDHVLLGPVVALPGGTFVMGAAGASGKYFDNVPEHNVTLSPFVMQAHEVTQAQYEVVLQVASPSTYGGCDDCPVETLTWDEAGAFAARVAELTGEPWRLPTEAEWEYAAAGGEDLAYPGSSSSDVAWTVATSGGVPHEVCTLPPNGYGLCDMGGNVWEWIADWYGSEYYAVSPAVDPLGPASGPSRVKRGGSWNALEVYARVTSRGSYDPASTSPELGLRLVRSGGAE